MTPIAVYVHIPFCPTKCGYCDFNSYALGGKLDEAVVERTVRAICRQIALSPLRGRPAKTVFFGGGTPTFLAPEQLIRVLDTVLTIHPPLPGCEITSEANPGTVDAGKFQAMKEAGFNRLSLGSQSFQDDDLIRLGRVHRASEIERAVMLARAAGFDNLNLDLMFGLPYQSRKRWQDNLSRAIALDPDHLSLYCLTIEPGTAFARLDREGKLDLPPDDDQVAMYSECHNLVTAAGYRYYEISNFAKPGFECRHNLAYWRAEEYAGYGPGAVGCAQTNEGEFVRTTTIKHPLDFCNAVEGGVSPFAETETLSQETRAMEAMMLGLRLDEGIPAVGIDVKGLQRMVSRGWIQMDGDQARLTPSGRHFCSEVTLALLP